MVCTIAGTLAWELGIDWEARDFTLPAAREEAYQFQEDDLVVLGTPVYAGRVPNVLLPFLKTVRGDHTPAIPVVVYGNRNFDDALAELRDILENQGFLCGAAAAFVGNMPSPVLWRRDGPMARIWKWLVSLQAKRRKRSEKVSLRAI